MGGGGGLGCQGGYERERRIEVIVKIKKEKNSGEGGQASVDVNEELKFCIKFLFL